MNPLDLGFVKPAEYGEGLAGLGKIAEDMRKAKKEKMGKQALQEAWASSDVDALSKVAIDYPDLAPQIEELSDMRRFVQEDTLRNNALTAMKALNISDPSRRNIFLTEELTALQKANDPRWKDIQEAVGIEDVEEQNKVLSNVIDLATRFEAIEPEQASYKDGKFSAKTVFYNDGSSMMSDPNTGAVVVKNPLGKVVEGTDRLMTLKNARQSGIAQEYDEAYAGTRGSQQAKLETEPLIQSRVERAISAQKAANEMVPQMQKMESNIRNYNKAIQLIDKGAETGVIDSMLPSFRQASIELDQIRGELGLDIVGAGKFGALSESELQFALDVAMPDSSDPVALRAWLVEKSRVQQLLLDDMRKAQSLMLQGYSPAEVYARMRALPKGVTNDDVRYNMNKYNMSELEVLEVMWQKSGMER